MAALDSHCAGRLDIRAVMSLWLSSNARSYGALNLYADHAHAFEPGTAPQRRR